MRKRMRVRTWMTMGAGTVVGAMIAFLVPLNDSLRGWLEEGVQLLVLGGKYLLFPLVACSMGVGVALLKRQKIVWGVCRRMGVAVVGLSAIVVLVGILGALLLPPHRIPVVSEAIPQESVLGLPEVMAMIFPDNLLRIVFGEGTMLLPLVVLAFFLGMTIPFDREVSEPTFNFLDSLGRLFYRMNLRLVQWYGLFAIFFAFIMVFAFREENLVAESGRLFITTGLCTLMLVGVFFPFLLFKIGRIRNPYRVLWQSLSPLLAGLLTGDVFFSLSSAVPHMKENLGVRREVGAFVLPTCVLFARMGSAMVTGIAFLTVIRSYSSLEVTIIQAATVFLFSWLTTFCLPFAPGVGVYVALSLVASLYGRGLERGFLLLNPILPALTGIAVFLDLSAAIVMTLIISSREGKIKEVLPEGGLL